MDLSVRDRRLLRSAPLLGGAVFGGVSGWLDWVQLGGRRRSSYAMFRSLQRLGLDELDPLRLLWWWLPVLALAVVGAVLAGRPRLALVPAAVLTPALAGATVAVVASGVAGGSGPWVALVGAALLGVGFVTNVQGSN